MNELSREPLFPEFKKYADEKKLIESSKGSSQIKIYRILGHGKTRAKGLDLPPAPIERMQEISTFDSQDENALPDSVANEIADIKNKLKEELAHFRSQEGIRRFSVQALKSLDVPTGQKNNHFFAGRFVLIPSNGGMDWAWSLTKHYPIVSKIPPDLGYLKEAHARAERFIEEIILPVEVFNNRIDLSWAMARHFSESSEQVLIRDVARMFKVAGQDDKFWNNPKKSFFTDRPDATFIANLMHSISRNTLSKKYNFIPATLHQSKQAFYFPEDNEGTLTRPMIYMIKK
ncbi:hypothetical protein [Desulfonatronum parangueonense]